MSNKLVNLLKSDNWEDKVILINLLDRMSDEKLEEFLEQNENIEMAREGERWLKFSEELKTDKGITIFVGNKYWYIDKGTITLDNQEAYENDLYKWPGINIIKLYENE